MMEGVNLRYIVSNMEISQSIPLYNSYMPTRSLKQFNR
jgi:hypothetical protein